MRSAMPSILSCAVLVFASGCGAVDAVKSTSTDFNRLPLLNTVAEQQDDDTFALPEQLLPALPNPERSNPFATATEETSATQHALIHLKGFVDRGESKAVLLVGESFAVVREQQVIGGVTIVSIRPPELVYEYDGTQHQLSL